MIDRNENYSIENDPSMTQLYSQICTQGIIFKSFDQLFQRLVLNLDYSNIAIKNKSLKSIQEIISLNEEMLLSDALIAHLKQMMMDHSASVRESVIEFLGRFIVKEKFTSLFYPIIAERILVFIAIA